MQQIDDGKRRKSIRNGAIAGFALVLFYLILLSIANSPQHAIEQFYSMWYWILILASGFGIQITLYSYIKYSINESIKGTKAEVIASGGISTGSMIACCAHHLVDVLPILGLSAASLFLLKYQIPFIILGIASNIAGITMMLNIIQKNKIYDETGKYKAIFKNDLKNARDIVIVLAIIIVALVFIAFAFLNDGGANAISNDGQSLQAANKLETKTNEGNGISIDVTPVIISEKLVEFEVVITTHTGSLDFDVDKISILEDAKGSKYTPLLWEGSPSGGHHRNGVLKFPELKEKPISIKLTMKNIGNIPERVFNWDMN